MAFSRRNLFSKVVFAVGAASIGIGIGGDASSQETCDSLNCDPFPYLGEKQFISRQDFNGVAARLSEEILIQMEKEGVEIGGDVEGSLKNGTYISLENLYSKYFDIE